MLNRNGSNWVTDQPMLRTFIGDPLPLAVNKEMPHLDEPCRRFLSMSTILFISSVGTDGRADVSPRGDPPGFIKILDERTIAIPDRPGNRRVDTMSNILRQSGQLRWANLSRTGRRRSDAGVWSRVSV